MSTLPTLLFAVALPKRFNFTARVYRRARRAYALFTASCPIWLPYAFALNKNRAHFAIVLAIASFLFLPTMMIILTLLIP